MSVAAPLVPHPLFRSFWMGGFECSSQINRAGARVDMVAATQHDRQADTDYALLASAGLRTARDAPRWHLIERRAGCYDFSSLQAQARAASRHSVQVLWDICHYGWPDDLDVFSPAFVERFARFSRALARFLSDWTDEPAVYAPVNEISFLAHAVGVVGFVDPIAPERGWELKQQLVRAAIAGMEAVWEIDPRARFVHVDPVVHVVAPHDRPELAEEAARRREWQFHAWDMLAGRLCPELGGAGRYLDIMGLNFYHDAQWEHDGQPLHWAQSPRDPRWTPLSALLCEVWERYRRPLFLSETSHFGVGRADWLREVTEETARAIYQGVPVGGLCVYPILDRPDWNDPAHWHNCGLWDLTPDAHGTLIRELNAEYAAELRRAQARLPERGVPARSISDPGQALGTSRSRRTSRTPTAR